LINAVNADAKEPFPIAFMISVPRFAETIARKKHRATSRRAKLA
jgi:hypothetical protein